MLSVNKSIILSFIIEKQFCNIFFHSSSDGPKLLQLNETSLKEPPFDVKEDEFRKLLIDSIKVLKGCHFKAINFWEIKNNNRFEFVFFSLFFESFPRLTFLYYYLLDNDHHIQQLTRLSQMNIADVRIYDFFLIFILFSNDYIKIKAQ